MPLTRELPGELFYFGTTFEKFLIHKAARILGVTQFRDQDGKEKRSFELVYPDGEKAHAEFVEESQGSYELLTYDEAVAKYGEEAFQ